MNKEIAVIGAKTLDRYTKNILLSGFNSNGYFAKEYSLDSQIKSDSILFQLHGAPQSEEDDKLILNLIKKSLLENETIPKVILLHRPDELQKFSELQNIFQNLKQRIGLVFFGDKCSNDPFYPKNNLILKKIIPHGFFPLKDNQIKLQLEPIIVGTHTTWGEMRSIEHALKLFSNIFKLNNHQRNIIGYLGGKPEDQLQINYLKTIYQKINSGIDIKFIDVHDFSNLNIFLKKYLNQNLVLVDQLNLEPNNFSTTFNTQIYFLGNKIRLGESSGSAHTSVSIPVVLEMNNAETVENLDIIKIPYSDVNNINSIDFNKGANLIFDSIKNNNYQKMLHHNLAQSQFWNNKKIGQEYLLLFKELEIKA